MLHWFAPVQPGHIQYVAVQEEDIGDSIGAGIGEAIGVWHRSGLSGDVSAT